MLKKNGYGAMLEQTAGNGDGIHPSLRRGFVPSSRILGLSSMFSCVSRLKEALGGSQDIPFLLSTMRHVVLVLV